MVLGVPLRLMESGSLSAHRLRGGRPFCPESRVGRTSRAGPPGGSGQRRELPVSRPPAAASLSPSPSQVKGGEPRPRPGNRIG